MIEQIKKLAYQLKPEVIAHRRHLHTYPELSFQEEKTSAYVAEVLTDLGIPHAVRFGDTYGVIGLIQGTRSSGPARALRADMDALPIQEASGKTYCSRVPGVMHACGHDVHTASLLGTAKILWQLRDKLSCPVKLIFQPGEEKLPGGASLLIKAGVLESPPVHSILGQHVHPELEVGQVGFCSGKFMASCDEIFLTIRGKGGHGAVPHRTIDPITIASQVIVNLQQVISRKQDTFEPGVLSIGKLYSVGGSTNIIPNEVKMEGTFRTMNESWRTEAHAWIRQIIDHTVLAFGGSYDLDILVGYPYLVNDEELTSQMVSAAKQYIGDRQVVMLPPRMTAEDFSFYSHAVPACFYRLGTGQAESGWPVNVHTDRFDVDEDCLEISMGLMAHLALSNT